MRKSISLWLTYATELPCREVGAKLPVCILGRIQCPSLHRESPTDLFALSYALDGELRAKWS